MTEPPTPSSARSRLGGYGVALLAVIGYVALADAAIETCWSGFGLRWPVVAATLAFLAVSIWLWRPGGKLLRRFGPGGAAANAVGGLLLLLAVTAWQPGGQTDGVRLLLQPTPVVLALASIGGVLLSVYVIVQALAPAPRTAKLVARAACLLLGSYAIVALAVAVHERPAVYSALFGGNAVWAWLPAWLQGTFVGAFVLMPIAILGQAVRLLRLRRDRQSAWVLMRQGTALVLVFAIALPALRPSASAPAGVGSLPVSDWRPRADQIGKWLHAVEVLTARLDRSTFDPKAVVAKVGTSPDGLLEWVRDNTFWVPYRGELRGAVGVLMDRLGNSLDRSLLLAALLKAAGHKVRLAHAQIPADRARDLLGRVRPVPSSRDTRPPDFKQYAAAGDLVAKEFDIDPEGTRRSLGEAEARAVAVQALVERRVAAQSEIVLRSVQPPAEGGPRPVGKDEAAVGDHWWVQHKSKGAWIDLDPLLPDARSGAVQAAPDETMPVPDGKSSSWLAARFCQEVEIRVVAEQWKDGRLVEHVALAHTLRPADVAGQRVAIEHVPLQWTATAATASNLAVEGLEASAAAVKAWVPTLSVGSALVFQSSVGIDGEVRASRGKQSGGMPSPAATTGIFNAFGGGEAGHSAPKAGTGSQGQPASPAGEAPGGRLTAEWLDFVVRVPGEVPRTIRRELFDLLGPAARAQAERGTPPGSMEGPGLRLLDQVEVLVQVGRYAPEFLADAFANSLLAQRSAILGLSAAPAGGPALDVLRKSFPISPILVNVAMGRFAGRNTFADLYLDRPNLLSYRTGVRRSASKARIEGVFDIVSNPVAPLGATDRTAAFRARVEQGVRDSVVEAELPAESNPGASAAVIFEEAAAAGVPPVVAGGTDGQALSRIEAPADAAARMRAAVREGYVLVVPARAVNVGATPRTGWYRVDPASGDTVGVLDTGFNGQGNSGYATTVKVVAVNSTAAVSYVGAGSAVSAIHSVWIDFLFWCIQNPGVGSAIVSGAASVVTTGISIYIYVDSERQREKRRKANEEEAEFMRAMMRIEARRSNLASDRIWKERFGETR